MNLQGQQRGDTGLTTLSLARKLAAEALAAAGLMRWLLGDRMRR